MYQHQHEPLPLGQLGGVPQPVVVLLEVLLQKDPAQRFQTPTELLKVMPTIMDAIDRGITITHQSLRTIPSADSRASTRRPPALGPEKISVAGLPVTGCELFGREEDIAFLNDAWANKQVNIVTVVAWAGVGKSTLVNHWLRRMAADHYPSADRAAERLCANDRCIPRFGGHLSLFGRFRVSPTIRDGWRSALALGRHPVSRRIPRHACRRLSVL